MSKLQLTDQELLNELKIRMENSITSLNQLTELNKELKLANVKLNESESLKSHFLSNITNELVNPFASILGLSKAIMSIGASDFEKAKPLAQLIYSEAFNLDFQLRNIFAAAKVESGQTMIDINNVDINSLINSVIDVYGYKSKQKKLTVNFNYTTSEEYCNQFIFPTDAEMLKLIMSNIVNNSIKFSSAASNIEINAGVLDNELFISIRDQGKGIPHDHLERIFDRFEKGNKEINSVNEGYGLGLSVTKAYIDILGGRIELTSEENKGTLIIISIPKPTEQVPDGFASDGNEFLFNDVGNQTF
ncbi:MAG: HAMP domain-containing sensor histidine kinase [Salinivirgaceae bacterium]|nr:HAMP domain-containing sensor histidine kinase [Salinivirgaceae bacterium]MDD4746618.1 HAMP domain-containing sensor histidine kinase [Salinivirgaceae bacterium]MDY0279682.1 HAMP domain-containing sensor histidine kinase [Salinivirgaceae bacterium]